MVRGTPLPTIATTGTDQQQIESLVRGFSARTEALDANASFALMCPSFLAKIDQKQVSQNMEGFKNAGTAAPKISNLAFKSITADGANGEALYSYTQDFRGQTTTINEGLKVAKEQGKWCIKDQIVVNN
nr:K421 [uncultured bacterium]